VYEVIKKKYDVIVVGGGHAGIEASMVASNLGLSVLLVTMSFDSIGRMSCNPAIGGQAKGHLVREIDALGGQMAQIIDQTGLHFKMLNRSKGPAVWSPRAQADKYQYEAKAQEIIANQKNLDVYEGIANSVIQNKNKIEAIKINDELIHCKTAILTCGTFLNGKIHIGMRNYISGRAGEPAAIGLTESLINIGFKTGRLKTGTPPRLDADSVNWAALEEQKADDPPQPFSFRTKEITNKQISMYIAYTNEKTHDYLRMGLDESPMYRGVFEGAGPRYCPSIEDKIVRFSERIRHQLFLEPEGYNTNEIYVNGFSTSLPEAIQVNAIKTIKGLEKANVIRLGYAIEYDYFEPYQLLNTMETRLVSGLYFAGQICGTSGYEEAASQGFIAGINAALSVMGKEPFVLSRSESYMGVLIDDLINKSTDEPYRMFTSSAEFRLLLRHDNADIRLMRKAYDLGLIDQKTINELDNKEKHIESLSKMLSNTKIRSEEFDLIKSDDKFTLRHSEKADQILKRPEIKITDFEKLTSLSGISEFSDHVKSHVEFEIKYDGYIARQLDEIERFKGKETKTIPDYLDYQKVPNLSNEAREKLLKIKPQSIGQASRISGIRPADLNVLLIYIEKESHH
jgi:tRNA uridine 5-carboxymethylaminomethyl modification enzyme